MSKSHPRIPVRHARRGCHAVVEYCTESGTVEFAHDSYAEIEPYFYKYTMGYAWCPDCLRILYEDNITRVTTLKETPAYAPASLEQTALF